MMATPLNPGLFVQRNEESREEKATTKAMKRNVTSTHIRSNSLSSVYLIIGENNIQKCNQHDGSNSLKKFRI
jgi:hypothetical protein